jgi:hypothetical protein
VHDRQAGQRSSPRHHTGITDPAHRDDDAPTGQKTPADGPDSTPCDRHSQDPEAKRPAATLEASATGRHLDVADLREQADQAVWEIATGSPGRDDRGRRRLRGTYASLALHHREEHERTG